LRFVEVLEKQADVISKILSIINQTTVDFKNIPSIDTTLALKYHQKIEDIQEWLSLTHWSKPIKENVKQNSKSIDST
jgi:hypothetical protein